MGQDESVPLTAEEKELIELWLERPPRQRGLDQVQDFADWVLSHRPHLLPKGADDARDYLVRLLGDSIESDADSSASG
ncbi:MAG TPA: hypothetical protein VFM98_17025 [Ramlibacter sp.]|nr:hypothetical protein [Ramlibacter sp.]